MRGPGSDSLAHAVMTAAEWLLEREPGNPHAADLVWRECQLALAHGWDDQAMQGLARPPPPIPRAAPPPPPAARRAAGERPGEVAARALHPCFPGRGPRAARGGRARGGVLPRPRLRRRRKRV